MKTERYKHTCKVNFEMIHFDGQVDDSSQFEKREILDEQCNEPEGIPNIE